MTENEISHSPICHLHNFIQDTCHEILDLLDDSIRSEQIAKKVSSILFMTAHAAKQGQKMEDRLRVYREGIENMGFKRIKS
jgi:hypothetical protein